VVLHPPVAAIDTSATSGAAPFSTNFRSSRSSDPDGSIVAYRWNFGDGTPESDVPNPAHTYARPGSYTATLRVTDNSGLSTSASVGIRVLEPATTGTMQVNDITLRAAKVSGSTSDRRSVSARVTVRGPYSNAVPGATVTGSYYGDASGVVTGVTGSDGVVQMPAVRSDAWSGTVSFRVLDIRGDGYVYAPAKNVETVDTIRWSAW
jgi:PKD repeat protein